jgi:hypothetical protein
MSKLDLSTWPTITFVLEGAIGTDVTLEVSPETYWQTDSPKTGYASAVLFGDNGQGGGQSILGLPLLNMLLNYYLRGCRQLYCLITWTKGGHC